MPSSSLLGSRDDIITSLPRPQSAYSSPRSSSPASAASPAYAHGHAYTHRLYADKRGSEEVNPHPTPRSTGLQA